MTKKQKQEISQISVDVWKIPEMRKLLRLQVAASMSPLFIGQSPERTAELALDYADALIKKSGA